MRKIGNKYGSRLLQSDVKVSRTYNSEVWDGLKTWEKLNAGLLQKFEINNRIRTR